MGSWSTPSSKILTIISDDYQKMLEKEKQVRSTSTVDPISSGAVNKTKKSTTINNSGMNLVRKFKTLVDKRGNVFSRVRFPTSNSFQRKSPLKPTPQRSSAQNRTIVQVAKPQETKPNNIAISRKQSQSESLNYENAKRKTSMKGMLWWNPPDESIPIDFCRDTSLHGLKYIGQQNRHISERVFWLVAFLSGLIIAVIMISDVWKKYNTSPIIVSFDPQQISVDRIPFPAVTVCNMNKVLKSKAEEYIAKARKDDSLMGKADAFYLDHVCSATQSFTKLFNFTKGLYGQVVKDLIKNLEAGELTQVNEFLRQASQNCSDMIPLCVWQDEEYTNCSQLFRPIETEFGKCCTFNMIPQSELYKLRNDTRDDETEIKEWMQWNSESNSDTDGVLLTGYAGNYPRRQMEPGKSYGLSFLLNPNLEEYFCTTSDSIGFRLATHWPTDTPHVTDFGISIRKSVEVFVNVKPVITLVDPTVYKFDTDVRQCYNIGEFPLEYYNYYTSRNCIDECIANETLKECKCKRYFMPRSENQTLCSVGASVECAQNVKANMTKYGARRECGQCLPSCSEIQYESQTTATPLQAGIFDYENGINEQFRSSLNDNVTIVHVFMGQDSTFARVRKELYGSTDLLANTGGLMGLCLGFSGLSLMEVFYFLTLRAWWASKRKDEIRKNLTKKVKSAWRKVKTLGLFWNGQSVLDKQAEQQVQELEKVVGSSPNRLHVSPVYSNNYNTNTTIEVTNENENVTFEQQNDSTEELQLKKLDYKFILGDI